MYGRNTTLKIKSSERESEESPPPTIKPRGYVSPYKYGDKENPFSSCDKPHSSQSHNSNNSDDSFESVKRVNKEESTEHKNITDKIMERMQFLQSNSREDTSNKLKTMKLNLNLNFGQHNMMNTSPINQNLMTLSSVSKVWFLIQRRFLFWNCEIKHLQNFKIMPKICWKI